MPSEVRNIVFNNDEVFRALSHYRARKGEPLPEGELFKFVVESKPKVRVVLAIAIDRSDRMEPFEFSSKEIGAALVMYCITLKIPLPARGAQKALQVTGDSIALVVTIGAPTEQLNEHVKTD